MWIRNLPRYFVRGAFVTVPVGLTLYILYWLFRTVDDLLPVGIPGLGLLITVAFVTLVGFSTSNVIGRTVFETTERVLQRVPLVKLLYNSIKDLVGAFVGDKKSFDQPVAVRFGPTEQLRALGFVTRRHTPWLGQPGHVAVYFPQSYNFAGNLVLVPNELVEPLSVSSGELMTFIVSGGVSGLGIGESMLPPAPALDPDPKQ